MSRLGDGETVVLSRILRDLTPEREAAVALEDARGRLEGRVRERTEALEAEVSQHVAAEHHVTLLLRRLVTAQEEERTRIARDLHDHLGQKLTALRLTLDRHRQWCANQEEENLRAALEQTRAIDEDIDFLAWELRPAVLSDLGLAAALPRFVRDWSVHYGITVECRSADLDAGALSPEAEVAYYRVAQESLNNVLKHAHASRVDVLLESRGNQVVLVVEDDGVGFDPGDAATTDRGIGLASMRERAALVGAVLEIESSPGVGTTVFLKRPLEHRSSSQT